MSKHDMLCFFPTLNKQLPYFFYFANNKSIINMLKKIKALEEKSRKLEVAKELRDHWNYQTQQYANHFLDVRNKGKTYVGDDQPKQLLEFQDNPRPIEELIDYINTKVDDTGLNPASAKHFGYIPGGGLFTTALADYIAATSNRYAGISYASPGGVRMENQLIKWMCKLMGYPESALGNLTSGGSIANLIAVVTARDYAGLKAIDYPKACIYLTEHVHHCVQKALRIAGLGEVQIRYVPVNEEMKMDTSSLDEQIRKDIQNGFKPFLIVASAGTTNTGVIDPLDDIAEISEKHNIWYHIDAAYGGFFILMEELKDKFKGIERSDSIAIDPHKGLFISYGLGAILVKNVKAVYDTHHYIANYMQDAINPDIDISPADMSPELTKHFRGMRMWLSMHLFGLDTLKAAIEEKIWLCRYFYKKIQEQGFKVGPYPELSVMIFRYIPEDEDADGFNQKLVQFIHDDGRVFLSSTTINGVFWIRMAIGSFRSHLEHVDLSLKIIEEGILSLNQKIQVES